MPKLWDPYEVRLRQTRSRRRVPAQWRFAHHHHVRRRRRAQLWPVPRCRPDGPVPQKPAVASLSCLPLLQVRCA